MDIRPNLKELKTTTANGSEKAWLIVTQKVNSRCFQLHRLYSNSFNASNVVILSGVESRRTVSKFTKRKGKSLLYAFTSSVKREIKKFRQKNVQKNVTQVQSCCFVNLLYCLVLPFSLPSTSSLLKLPLDFTKTENILAFYIIMYSWLL